jgi:hypothetical protein
MNKIVLAGIFFLLISPICFSQTESEEKAYLALFANPEQKIIPVLTQYANSIGCAYDFNPKNIVQYSNVSEKSFVVLFSLDVGCSGGNAMSRPVIALMQFSELGKIYVNPKYSTPSQTSEKFPSHTENIYLENGKLKFKAREYDFAKDPLSSPSVIVTGEIEFKNSFWQPRSQEK